MPRVPLLLIVAGLAAAVFSQVGRVNAFTLFGSASDLPLGLGLEWVARVPDLAGGLGLSAALCGVIQWRWPDRAVAAIVAVLLVLGTVLLVWCLVAVSYPWWLWVSAAALLVAALAATVLATRPAAAPRA